MKSPGQYDPSVSLLWGDVAVDSTLSPLMVRVHLKRSKSDQFGRGIDVIMGCTSIAACPVTAIKECVALRQDQPGLFFINTQGGPVTKSWLVQQIWAVLSSIGLPQNEYAGHSFRSGAATSAAIASVKDSMIQMQSAAFLQYICLPREQLAAFLRCLALANEVQPMPVGGQSPGQNP